MTFQFTPISLMYLLAAVINLFTALINWRRRHGRQGIATLSLAIFATGLWLVGNFFELAVVNPVYKESFMIMDDGIGGFSYVLLLLFILSYFELWSWFKGWWHKALWLTAVANAVLGWTNSIHHWFWTYFQPGPAGSNVIYYGHGPLWIYANIYFLSLIALSLILVIYKAIVTKNHERKSALFMVLALTAPYSAYLIFALLPDQFTGLLSIPFGFSITALMIDWAVVEDFRFDVQLKTSDLEFSVAELQRQIDQREKLEQELRGSEEFLSMRLASQSSKLAGVYDLILLSGKVANKTELIQTSVNKIATVMNCRLTFFFTLDQNQDLILQEIGRAHV